MKTMPSFDELKALAESDPQALDALRIEMSEEIIVSASDNMQPKLRAQMSHINRVIASGKNPNHVNALLMKELMRQFDRFSTAINDPAALTERNATVTTLHPKRNSETVAVEG
ncbi:hypothetical protein A1OO_07135 [Enterovibrio norvegicus FF-33]|uniref:DUF3135 domain-containing protein n=1 Tax=Enterovibrio norvegicus FF-454 TaxID=1185651 RepID=A0A1E5CFZ9_9GAMM|nr:DUF3135 domain-containing protein [Enterovibrio norvegicus]OEE64417.1 hypothetical protein A1OK_00430 [Enterovibrio norvegicus FF-454]OEE68807.1 hypothetical protein A1OO_07135 [Enterovibrio norvegicus FF-33]OEE89214.1 hypothetical protein A1OQ_11980 [Enterovibrio norvegicus FF-162]